MPDFPDVPSLTKQPGPLVAEILSRDSRVPAVLREDRNDYLGDREDYELDRERYYSADFYRLEVERMWSRTWQIACRLEEIPRVGDHIIYEIADKSLIVVRSKPGEIKAFHTPASIAAERCARAAAMWRISAASSTALPGISTGSSALSPAAGIFHD